MSTPFGWKAMGHPGAYECQLDGKTRAEVRQVKLPKKYKKKNGAWSNYHWAITLYSTYTDRRIKEYPPMERLQECFDALQAVWVKLNNPSDREISRTEEERRRSRTPYRGKKKDAQ